MSLKTKVKAGNITNLSDARYCAGMGVDWLSFPSDVVNSTTFKEITDWVTGPQFVLEVKEGTSIDSIGEYNVTTLEIIASQLNLIDHMPSMQWIIRFPLSDWTKQKSDLVKFKSKISQVVLKLDSQDLNAIADIAAHFNVLIDQPESNLLESLLSLPVEGINVYGENELKPGLKDFERLASILEELEIID